MKRFKWPLQRLLNVTEQREKVLRAELFALSRDIAWTHQEIFRHQTMLRTQLANLSIEQLSQRIPKQELFMTSAKVTERILRELGARLEDLKGKRGAKAKEFAKIKTSRETLERMRQEAQTEHTRQELRTEQKVFDERAQIAFARGQKQAARST